MHVTAAPALIVIGGSPLEVHVGADDSLLPGGFTVIGGTTLPFEATDVTPASGAAGAALAVTISGSGFQPGTVFDFGDGIGVANLVIVDAATATATATATLTIAPGATLGPRDVAGSQAPGGATARLAGGFTVTGGSAPPESPSAPVPTLGTVGTLGLVLGFAWIALMRPGRLRRIPSE